MYEQLGDGYFEFGDGDGTYTVARSDADTITITSSSDISGVYFAGRKIRITDGGANVVEGTIASSSHSSTTQTVNLTGISLASGTPTKVELGIDTAAFGGRVILDDDGDTYIEAVTDDTIDIYVAGAKDFVITANDFTAESGSVISTDTINESTSGSGVTIDGVLIKDTTIDVNGTAGALILDTDADTKIQASTDDNIEFFTAGKKQFNLTNSGSVQAFRDGGTTFGPSFNGQHQRGTIASPSIVQSGDRLVEFKSTAYDGTAYIDGPRISFRVDGTPGDDDMPSRIEFQTVADGSNSLVERMRITSAGIIGMGATASGADLGTGLHIKTADSSASANANFDELVIEGSGATGLCVLTPNNQTGGIAFGDDGDNDRGRIAYDHSNDRFFIDTNGNDAPAMFFHSSNALSTSGETAPDVGEGGITLDQNAGDNNILTFKSSDIAHGMTAIGIETDSYALFQKNSADNGGLRIISMSESNIAFKHEAFGTGENTAESAASTSNWCVDARKKNGTTVAGLAADDNLASFRTSDEAQFIIKGDGELFSNTTATVGTYDAYEDAQLVRAYDLSHMKGVIDSKFDKFVQYNKDDLQKARLIGTDEKGNATPFVNLTGMSRLHNGAIWQQYEATQRLTNAMYELAKVAVGEDKANEILEQNEIKLLN
jgi:hypothetical protein